MIRISIVEDDRKTREGLLELLREAPEVVCFGSYENAEDAERSIPTLLPDIVLMDISLPGSNGVECVARLKKEHPQIQFVMLTTYDDDEMIFNALRAGASGYLLKRNTGPALIAAIEEVHRGGSPMSMQIARKVVSHFHQVRKPSGALEELTKREHEVLALLAKGLQYKHIADQLGISLSTVHTHLHKVYGKLHVQSRAEAVIKFQEK